MRFFKMFGAFFILVFSLLSFSACAPKGSVATFSYFNTVVRVETHGTILTNATKTQLNQLFSSLQNQFDCNSGSVTHSFNTAAVGTQLSLDDSAVKIISAAKDCYAFSEGKFNPSVLPLVQLWGFSPYSYTQNFTPPTQAQIELEKQKCDFDKAELDKENRKLTKNADVKLDFGGLVKGYPADKAGEILKGAGHKKGYVSVGGSSLCLLMSKTLSLTHPRKSGAIITVNTDGKNDLSVSTSGDYEKFYTADGVRYSHLIDVDTGYPSKTGVMSATILGVEGVYSDALTTALCLKDYNLTPNCPLITFVSQIKNRFPAAEFYIVYGDQNGGQVLTNKKQGEDFTLLDDNFVVVNI